LLALLNAEYTHYPVIIGYWYPKPSCFSLKVVAFGIWATLLDDHHFYTFVTSKRTG